MPGPVICHNKVFSSNVCAFEINEAIINKTDSISFKFCVLNYVFIVDSSWFTASTNYNS